ncbi:MAG: hypothetical protein IKY82_01970 [Alistipes sp.]|nr:hypothetical protein [Alistipes sp.]
MKKIILAFCIAAMAFVGCSKDEFVSPASEYQIVVNLDKPSFGEDVRAARTSWESGDEVYVTFNGDVYVNFEVQKYLKLTYNGSSWTPTWVGTTAAEVAAKETKTLTAGYMNSASNVSTTKKYGFLSFGTVLDNGICIMTCNDGTYSVSGSTITLNIVMRHQTTQVTVKGINVADKWTLKCDKLLKKGGFTFASTGVGTSNYNYNDPLQGFDNADGVSFFGSAKSFTTSDTVVFTLTNGAKTYTRSFTGKTFRNGDAIIMDGPDSGKWDEVTE